MTTMTTDHSGSGDPPDDRFGEIDLLCAYMALRGHPWGAMTPIAGDLAGVCLAAQAFVLAFEKGFPNMAAAVGSFHG